MKPKTAPVLTKNRRGALLLEILLALVILSVSLGVIIGAMTASMRSARFAAQYTQAAIAADAEMTRQIKEKRFADGSPLGEPEEINADGTSLYDFSVDSESSQESGDLEILRLTTEWKGGRKNNRLVLSTYTRTSP